MTDTVATSTAEVSDSPSPQYVDVLIVGAGLSGIGGACYLQRQCPDRTFMILESREAMGGTWDLFRYPGIRSDSDMFTLGYAFKPWTDPKSLADGPSILKYIRETAKENAVEPHIRYEQRVISADWQPESASWLVTVQNTGDESIWQLSCGFIYSCSGYYHYTEPYTPSFSGEEVFAGPMFHAQHWPESLDYAGKRVVVVGSGATAVTLVPELAKTAASVTMLQRSPTYIAALPAQDAMAINMRKWLPESVVYHFTRVKKILIQILTFNYARSRPERAKQFLVKMAREQLGEGVDVDTHFTPRYNPWDERICAVPDGDLFTAVREGRAQVVTDHIDHFTADGITLRSGESLPADIVVLATGLNLLFMGGMQLTVDGERIDPSERFLYKGMMLSGVPNFAQAFGYTNSSWTLKADLTAQYVCRLLNRMRRDDKRIAVAELDPGSVTEAPMLDFSSGYVQRAADKLPKQATRQPWRVYQNYIKDLIALRFMRLQDSTLRFR